MKEIHLLFQQYPELLSCAGFLAGLLIGNWIAIGRDKRKEYNEIIFPMRGALVSALNTPQHVYWNVTSYEIDALEQYLSWWQRKRFRTAYNKYRNICNEQLETNAAGKRYYRDVTPINACVVKLLKLLNIR